MLNKNVKAEASRVQFYNSLKIENLYPAKSVAAEAQRNVIPTLKFDVSIKNTRYYRKS